jgi:hypothetical protein
MNPIAECLSIHPIGRRRLAARMTIQNHGQRQQAANLRAVAALASEFSKPATRVVGPCDL